MAISFKRTVSKSNRPSEEEVAFAAAGGLVLLEHGRIELRKPLLDARELLLDERVADLARLVGREVVQPLAEREDRVDLAELPLAAGLERVHDAPARPSAPVARRAERGNRPARGQIALHLVDHCVPDLVLAFKMPIEGRFPQSQRGGKLPDIGTRIAVLRKHLQSGL